MRLSLAVKMYHHKPMEAVIVTTGNDKNRIMLWFISSKSLLTFVCYLGNAVRDRLSSYGLVKVLLM